MSETDPYEIVRQKLTLGPYSADKHEKTYELMKLFWNKEDIEILAHFPDVGQSISVKELVKITGKPKSHIKEILLKAAKKKTIAKFGAKYGLVPLFPHLLEAYFWAKQDTEENLRNAAKAFRYILKHPVAFQTKEVLKQRAKDWENLNFTTILSYEAKDRLIEINESVEVGSQVLPYEILENVINKNEKFVVVTCPCRLVGELSGDPCSKAPAEMGCIFMGIAAQLFLELGWGRPLTKEETIQYLKKTEEAGLIHNIPGGDDEILGFCNCCTCHCGILIPTKEVRVKNVNPSNFAPIHDQERCILCETCVKKCQMEAVSKHDEKIIVNNDLCLGCGVCATNCPENAIKMKKVRNRIRSIDGVEKEQQIYGNLVDGLWR